MKSVRILCFFLLALSLAGLPAVAERGLTIDAVDLNGFTTRDITVKPGGRITGTVTVSTSSSSFFRTHTGVWMPSWDRRPEAVRAFLNSAGGASGVAASIDIEAPAAIGVHYLLFCFDRKGAHEMYNELILRSDEQIYANGRAIKVLVDAAAPEPQRPTTRETAASLVVGGAARSGKAGHGTGNEAWYRIDAGNLSSTTRDEAIRISVAGTQPATDLDFEVQDANGRRRGWSENEGSKLETSVVRVSPNEAVYVRVFAFKQGEEAPFSISAKAVRLSTARVDMSGGKALSVSDGYSATARAGEGTANSSWYKLTFPQTGSFDVEVRGSQPSRDIDLWIYDDLGNLRASSREDGSALEKARVDYAESGVYYVRVGAFRQSDAGDFSILVRASGASAAPSVPVTSPVTVGPVVDGTALDSGQRCPVNFEVAKDRPYTGYLRVTNEPSFLMEVFTGWGEEGKIDSLKVIAPDGTVIWERAASGRGWEAERVSTRGAGLYRVVITHSGTAVRKGRIDVQGLGDPHIYPPRSGNVAFDPGTGGTGLDASERDILQKLYEMFNRRGTGISSEEAAILKQTEDYFQAH